MWLKALKRFLNYQTQQTLIVKHTMYRQTVEFRMNTMRLVMRKHFSPISRVAAVVCGPPEQHVYSCPPRLKLCFPPRGAPQMPGL